MPREDRLFVQFPETCARCRVRVWSCLVGGGGLVLGGVAPNSHLAVVVAASIQSVPTYCAVGCVRSALVSLLYIGYTHVLLLLNQRSSGRAWSLRSLCVDSSRLADYRTISQQVHGGHVTRSDDRRQDSVSPLFLTHADMKRGWSRRRATVSIKMIRIQGKAR